MEDIFLNADIRLVQDDKKSLPPILITNEEFEELCKDPEFLESAKLTPLNKAYVMLNNIKDSLSLFYVRNPPINRKERRERIREIKREILRFKGYCKKNGIHIENSSE